MPSQTAVVHNEYKKYFFRRGLPLCAIPLWPFLYAPRRLTHPTLQPQSGRMDMATQNLTNEQNL